MINSITSADLALIKKLGEIKYTGVTMAGSVSKGDKKNFDDVRSRLKAMAEFFKERYDKEYGVFLSAISKGNPVERNNRLKRVWSGIFKGSDNKQYGAQISFVIDPRHEFLDVGFYFGRASGHSKKGKKENPKRLKKLQQIGIRFQEEINDNLELKQQFYELFNLGFRAEIRNEIVSSDRWLENAGLNPSYSSVIISLNPNDLGLIDLSDVDFYVSLVMPFMKFIPENLNDETAIEFKKGPGAKTPEQWAKRAEKLALIGLAGEQHVMKVEKERLVAGNISKNYYPFHMSLTSDSKGYDVLSCDLQGNELFIEVKTTTLIKDDSLSKSFFLSIREYEFYKEHKAQYKLYRVWDIYGKPSIDEIDLEQVVREPGGYKVTIR